MIDRHRHEDVRDRGEFPGGVGLRFVCHRHNRSIRRAVAPLSREHVETFDRARQSHGGIDIAFWKMKTKSVCDEGGADQQKKAERQHYDGWIATDEIGEWPA